MFFFMRAYGKVRADETLTSAPFPRGRLPDKEEEIMKDRVFDQSTFMDAFAMDLELAHSFVMLQTPYLSLTATKRLSVPLKTAVGRGIRVCMFFRAPDNWGSTAILDDFDQTKKDQFKQALNVLRSLGVHVNVRRKVHEKIGVIDARIIWDGSLNASSYNPQATTERMTRSEDIFRTMDAINRHTLLACEECFKSRKLSEAKDVILMPDSVGSIIKSWRMKLGLSQRDLATATGINCHHLSRIESQKVIPSLGTIFQIMQALGLQIAVLPDDAARFAEQYLRSSQHNYSKPMTQNSFVFRLENERMRSGAT